MSAVDNWILMCGGRAARAWIGQDHTVLGLDPDPGVPPWDDSHTLTLQDLGDGIAALSIQVDVDGNGTKVPVYASMRALDDHGRVHFQYPTTGQWITDIGPLQTFFIIPTGDGCFALQGVLAPGILCVDPAPDPAAGNCNPLYGVSTRIDFVAHFTAIGQSQPSALSIVDINQNIGQDSPFSALRTASGLSFRGADLARKALGGPGFDLSHCDFRGVVDVRGASLAGTNLQGAVFAGVHMGGLDLSGADCTGADFTGADFTGFVLGTKPPTMTGATFTRAVIPWTGRLDANAWTGAQMHGAVLAAANLSANFLGPNTDMSEANFSGAGITVLTPDYQGTGIAGYSLGTTADRVLAFDCDSTGHLDHLVCYRPGRGAIVIANRRADGTYGQVYLQGDPGSGIGSFDLSHPVDRIIAFDWSGSGRLDHLLCYRPGTGLVKVLAKDADGKFATVFTSTTGIGDFPLTNTDDRIIAFDWNTSKRLDYLLCTRPGAKLVTILERTSDTAFNSVWRSTAGIGNWDLGSASDQVIAYDYNGSGSLDHVVCYRPGTGGIAVLQHRSDDTFTPVYWQGDPGNGIGDFSLTNPADRIIAYDFDGTGRLDHLFCYRPGIGIVRILAKQADGAFVPVYDQPGGIAGYDFTAPTDVAVAFDPTGTGTLTGLALCRPGPGTLSIVLPQPQGPAIFTGCLFGDTNLTGADFSGTDLSTTGLMQGAILTRAKLRGATLTGVNLTGANIKGSDFTGCDLSTVILRSPFNRPTDPDAPTIFAECTVPYAMLGLDWSCLDLTGASITGLPSDLTGLNAHGLRRLKGDFTGLVLDGVDFSSATLDQAMFTGAKLRAHGTTPTTFDQARLMGASFTEAVLDQTRFTDAALGGVSQSESAADFSYAFLANCSFTGANLYGVLFVGATLLSGNNLAGTSSMEEVDFAGAYLAGADLTQANLKGAKFDFAFMVEVVLHGADLTPSGAKPASLASAFLQAADFTGTKLAGANLVGAAITNARGQIQQQYYDENGDLTPMTPMRYPAHPFPLASSFDDDTTCPNGLTFAANNNLKNTLAQMMTLKNPPTSWSPPSKRPLAVRDRPHHPHRHRDR